MSDDSNTPPASQGQARNGQARHAGNAEARWRALTSYPDFCQVGDKIVGFDSEATLGNPVNYSPNVITAGQRTYRVGDLCQGTEGNDGSGVGSGTSQGSGHVLFLTGQDNVKANGQPVVHDGSECTINCNAAGVGGAKGYVHTNTESVNSQPEESSEPLSEAERFQQQAKANLERLGELREALNNNPNGKTTAEAEALYAEVQQLVSETQAQQEAFNEADRAGLFSRDEMVQSDLWVGQAANSARNMVQQAERQLSRSNARGTWGDVVIGFNPVIGGLQLLEEVGDGIRSGQYGQAILPVLVDSTPIGRSLGSMVKKVFGGFKKPKRVDRDSSSSTNDTSANQRETGQDNEGLRVEENSGRVESGGLDDTDPNIVYRAITPDDAVNINNGSGVLAKAPAGEWSAAEHVANSGPGSGGASANSPWISTSRNLDVARSYDGGNGIISIDLNKINSLQVEVWQTAPRVNGVRGLPYHRSIWAEEVTIFESIPQSAILGPIR